MQPREISFRDVRQDDTIRITGRCCSCRDVKKNLASFVDLVGVVGAAGPAQVKNGVAHIKVWPENENNDPDGCGKIWFVETDVKRIVLLDREE